MKGIESIIFILIFVIAAHASNLETIFENASIKNNNFEVLLNLAKKGRKKAEYLVGLMYETGQGTKSNYDKAALWYKKAANEGYSQAQYNLAFMYRYGYGVKRNLILSYKWFYILGDTNEIEFDAEMMTPEEIKRAKEGALKWLMSKKPK